MAVLELESLTKRFGRVAAVDDLSLTIDHGLLVCLLGPSGCGKTTTLRLIAGFVDPDAGSIRVGGRTISAPGRSQPPERRNMSMIFQSYALWPHMTTFENIAYGLTLRRVGKAELARRVAAILEATHLAEFAARYPSELSGGQQQRVALVRAQWLLGRRSYAVIGGKSGAPRRIGLGIWRWPALTFALAVLALPILLPYAALIKTAIVRTPSDPLTLDTLTLHNIQFVFLEFSQTRQALWNTVLLGVLAATGGTFLALTVSYVTQRGLVTGHRFLGFLATAPIAIPGIVLGVGLFLSYTRPPLVLYGTLWILLLAFLTIELPAGYQQLQAAFRGLHPELEEAGRIFGASRLGVLWRITAPLLRTSVIATWCFVFIGVIRELSATIMLTTAQTKVVSVIIYDLNESGDLGAISVLGITLLVITFLVVGVATRLPVLGRPQERLV